jgi:hypothetical protein
MIRRSMKLRNHPGPTPDIGGLTMSEKPKDTEPTASQPALAPALQEGDHRHDDDNLDEALEETFPASDPIAPSHIE